MERYIANTKDDIVCSKLTILDEDPSPEEADAVDDRKDRYNPDPTSLVILTWPREAGVEERHC